MKKGLIERATEEFRNKTLNVYKADPERIVRDARSADRAAKDHTGRWLFELLQNSDDAGATEVLVLVKDDTVYVADNGNGLKPEAVSAICGTDFSDKSHGTIGRKGIGFKSVYEVTQNPQVLTVDGEGIEFSPEKTKKWLREKGLYEGHVPYQWIPFFIPWVAAQRVDSQLGHLVTFRTVVKLPGLSQEKKQKVEQLLREWEPHTLFAFRHLRKITAPGLEVIISTGDGVWSVHDSRGQAPDKWHVAMHTEYPSADLLVGLGKDEQRAISKDGVSFLVAAPLENDRVVPTTDYLPVHVFYPTEQKGPVRLLLHAEFLVKSDRTALMPVDGNLFNEWVANRLAYYVSKFVNDSFHPELPSSHAALLVPFPERTSHPVAETLWLRIVDEAKKCMRVADVEGCQRLCLEEALLISVSIRTDLARTVLEATDVRKRLLHRTFDEDKEARKALKELGCKEIDDQELMAVIAENAYSHAADTRWVWTCWQWLAAWADRQPYGEEHRKRIEQIKGMPIVPVGGKLLRASDLAGRIVTWKPDAGVYDLPDWLPLTFVEDWFRDRIQNEDNQEPSVKELSKELGISKPGADIIQNAVARAIEQYWKDKKGDPGRFLRFIMEQDWHETSKAMPAMQRCPVPLAHPIGDKAWDEAGSAYFGREWGNDLLGELYDGIAGVAWVANDGALKDYDTRFRVLEWLGVSPCPRIVEECRGCFIWELPEGCDQWKQYLFTARDYCGRSVKKIDTVSRIDHISMDKLEANHGTLLIRLIVQHWEAYYRSHAEVIAEGRSGREQYYRPWRVKAKWWWEVCEKLPLPLLSGSEDHIALNKLWLPEKRTKQAIGDLLPVVDVDAFGKDKDILCEWLISNVGLRTRIEQLTIGEWEELLSRRIPEKAPAGCLALDEWLRDKVTGWYAACLETVAEQGDVSEGAFASCPLLCQKGDIWRYVVDEPRYLVDDNDLAKAFAEDVWLFNITTRLASDAVKYLGVLSLSESVQVDITPGEPKSPLPEEMQDQLNASIPYIWVWRSSQSKQAAERLSNRLKKLNVIVVPTLKASLSMNGIYRQVERKWHDEDNTIYIHKDHTNVAELAQALAKALEVRSDGDFYENLLRCADDRQRREKLLSKGIPDAEIDRLLREYSGQPECREPSIPHGKPKKNEQDNKSLPTPSSAGGDGNKNKQSSDTQSGDTSKTQSLRVKDPKITPYVFNPPIGDFRVGGSGMGESTGRHSLTEAEKADLEAAGKALAKRELESMGFSVEEMPQGNPGFDLRATKDGNEFRVEVKAHGGRATIVDLTHREYLEYLRQQGYRWELWNVEHLAENDPNIVVITPYNEIPDDALDTRTFRVDLKKCRSKLQD